VTSDGPPGGPPEPADPVESAAVRRDVDRVVAFSDGVFAIAITLLVLTIRVPDLANDELGDVLEHLRPEVFGYALSFLVVGLYWRAHHQAFRSLLRVDSRLLSINLLLLGLVALIPFPTEVLGKYADQTAAVVLYAATMGAVGYTSTYVWYYLNRAQLVAPSPPIAVRTTTIRGAIAPTVFVCSIPIAFASTEAAELSWIAIAIANIVVNHRYGAGDG
jgi:uncharacterized membrane protein